ncbi:MAG: arginase [Chitinophagia bacterium]|jgi:arginase family enzyme|nr:arginase [Chitinophagia bacterium]NCA29766.1 arginase [Chitinophagia bacterium]NDD15515.1 arginase [Chitinophagia bacterium]
MSLNSILDYLEPINLDLLSKDEGYRDTQLGKHIKANQGSLPDISKADMVLIGAGECRGGGYALNGHEAANAVRGALYSLYYWHTQVAIVDLGNVKLGQSIQDSYAALRTVISELLLQNKKVVIMGGSHDLSLAQYHAYTSIPTLVNAVVVDAKIDLDLEARLPADHFLEELFTGLPNHLNHYAHIGFQSYFMHPHMLETIDKLRFDCYRLGKVREDIEEMEPAIRDSHMMSFDISAIQNAQAPANLITPNGFNGEEACILMQYAGMSWKTSTIGLFGYQAELDNNGLTAIQMAQMIWYVIDGVQKGKKESPLSDAERFKEFHIAFSDIETNFLQSKTTGRWWMQTHNNQWAPCSYKDYLVASNNEIPERWLRALERE